MAKRFLWGLGLWAVVGCLLYNATPLASADTLQSPHYKFDESVLGGGGLIQSNSTNFQSSEAIGGAAGGDSASTNFQFSAGGKTSSDPTLSFGVTNGNVNFGSFTPSSASVSTATFSVSDYTSYGYVVQIIGGAPSNGTHTITALASNTASTAGIEQFGINLVANTLPVSVGANPVLGQFGAGVAAANYNTPNSYRYVSGETIASAPKSSGVTNFTMTYLVNVNSLTTGGQYAANQVLICTGTY